MNLPLSELRAHWALDPNISYLNHGSFGACPLPVLREQSRLRDQMEQDSTEFFFAHNPKLWDQAIGALAQFLSADARGLAFVNNATVGLNTVLAGLDLKSGDEIILSDHTYAAFANSIDRVCKSTGASPNIVAVPSWFHDSSEIERAYLSAISKKTKYALIETVTSPTAIRLPFENLIEQFEDHDIDVILDAAHGPGLVDLDLDALNAAYVVGNCHKWLYTPKGSGFLHVRADKRQRIEPLITSHGYSSRKTGKDSFREEFDWQGTQDPTPWLCIPKAIEFIQQLVPGGWPEAMKIGHELSLYTRKGLSDLFGEESVTPLAATTAMVTAKIPPAPDCTPDSLFDRDPLMRSLSEDHNIQPIVFWWPAHKARYLRISTPFYCSQQEIDRLLCILREHF